MKGNYNYPDDMDPNDPNVAGSNFITCPECQDEVYEHELEAELSAIGYPYVDMSCPHCGEAIPEYMLLSTHSSF